MRSAHASPQEAQLLPNLVVQVPHKVCQARAEIPIPNLNFNTQIHSTRCDVNKVSKCDIFLTFCCSERCQSSKAQLKTMTSTSGSANCQTLSNSTHSLFSSQAANKTHIYTNVTDLYTLLLLSAFLVSQISFKLCAIFRLRKPISSFRLPSPKYKSKIKLIFVVILPRPSSNA